METIKIEKNVPITKIDKTKGNSGRPSKYPFDRLEIDDSFFVACEHSKNNSSTISTSANQYRKRNAPDKEFTKRQVEGGYRVWRIK